METWEKLYAWLDANVLTLTTAIQGAVILASLLLGLWLGHFLKKRIRRHYQEQLEQKSLLAKMARSVVDQAGAILSLTIIQTARITAEQLGTPFALLVPAASLLTAWIVIKLASALVRDAFWSRFVALAAWTVAALNIAGLLGPTTDFLDSLSLTLGSSRISVLSLIKAAIILFLLLQVANRVSAFLDKRLQQAPSLTPSMRVLLGKSLRITAVVIALLIALSSTGINLAALTVFSGAIGVGIGFGLQKVFSNLASGFILLMDKSVKPGDIIQIGDTYGWITSMHGRYTSLTTRDGVEYLIPNEDLITQQVINWSFADRKVRLKVELGVAYDTDLNKAMDIMAQAARGVERVLENPAPAPRLIRFGDSSIDLDLCFWIRDPENGVTNIRSQILLRIWEGFKEAGIQIPFPQRDVHLNWQDPKHPRTLPNPEGPEKKS